MWDYLVAKAPINLPKLQIKSQNEKQLEILLQPIKEMIIPSDTDSDCSSRIIDTFEEFHKDSFLCPLPGTKTKFLTKQEADWKTVNQFTNDFKSTMKETRENLKLDDSLTSENDQIIEKVLSSNEKNIFFINTKRLPLEEPLCVPSEVLESEATSNSAVWNMIKANRKEYFLTSPPQYDIYSLKPDHYLKRPHVTWEEVEDSRRKCEKWLQECEVE